MKISLFKGLIVKHQQHRINYTPEPAHATYRTGVWEYIAGACLGAILAVLILAYSGLLFTPV